MASMRDIKRRRDSIQSTVQITKAMKLVATVKLQKSKAKAENSKPYFNLMYETISSVLCKSGNLNHKYLKAGDSPKKAVIVLTSNRGLAGGYNSNIIRLVNSSLPAADTYVYALGRKGRDGLARRGFQIKADYSEVMNEPMYRDEGAGAVQQVWVRDGTTLTWQYVTDPICPFETPEGEPEEIDLRGVTGWYWTAEEEPEESDGPTITVNGKEIQAEGSSVTVGGVTIITGGSPDMEETGTLIWTDPDTNTTFFLEGALDRFDLRDMAVRTEETEPQLSPPTKRAQSITGTAGGGK